PDTQFPVLRLFICQNRFQEDLGFAAVDVVRQATLAMNAWFTYGNIHLRMRYAGDLAATDPLCAEWPSSRPPNGTILLTARTSFAGQVGDCAWGGGGAFAATERVDTEAKNSMVVINAGCYEANGTY